MIRGRQSFKLITKKRFYYNKDHTKGNSSDKSSVQGKGGVFKTGKHQWEQNKNNEQRNLGQNQHEGQQYNSKKNLYCRELPKISRNFEKCGPNIQNNNKNIPNPNTNASNSTKSPPATIWDKVRELTPSTLIETFVPRVGHILVTLSLTIVLKTTSVQTTKQGQQDVIFDRYDYLHTQTVDCKFTFVGKFSTIIPKVELIRKIFIHKTQLRGEGQHCLLQCETCLY